MFKTLASVFSVAPMSPSRRYDEGYRAGYASCRRGEPEIFIFDEGDYKRGFQAGYRACRSAKGAAR